MSSVEKRLDKLEISAGQIGEMLTILKSLQSRLLGDISNETPGIISDVRQLKNDREENKEAIKEIRDNIQDIKTNQITRMNHDTEIASLKKEVENLKKYSLIGYGIFLAVGWLVSKMDLTKITQVIK